MTPRERAEFVRDDCRHMLGDYWPCLPCIEQAISTDRAERDEPWGDPWCTHPRACSLSGKPEDCTACSSQRFASALLSAFDADELEPHTIADCPMDDTCECQRAADINAAAKYLRVEQ